MVSSYRDLLIETLVSSDRDLLAIIFVAIYPLFIPIILISKLFMEETNKKQGKEKNLHVPVN